MSPTYLFICADSASTLKSAKGRSTIGQEIKKRAKMRKQRRIRENKNDKRIANREAARIEAIRRPPIHIPSMEDLMSDVSQAGVSQNKTKLIDVLKSVC